MHIQSRNPFRERDHQISLLPMERPADEPPVWLGVLILAMGLAVIFGALAFVHVLASGPADSTPARAAVVGAGQGGNGK